MLGPNHGKSDMNIAQAAKALRILVSQKFAAFVPQMAADSSLTQMELLEMSIPDYRLIHLDSTEFGGALEIQFIARMFKVNIQEYVREGSDIVGSDQDQIVTSTNVIKLLWKKGKSEVGMGQHFDLIYYPEDKPLFRELRALTIWSESNVVIALETIFNSVDRRSSSRVAANSQKSKNFQTPHSKEKEQGNQESVHAAATSSGTEPRRSARISEKVSNSQNKVQQQVPGSKKH